MNKAKNNFVIKFIKAVIETGKELHEVWQWQPIYYKGFHVSGRDYHRQLDVGISNLANRGMIKKLPKKRFKFTNKGHEWFRGSLLKHYKLFGIKWDKKWRILIFDIPQELNRERNKLRVRLRSLGFYMLQKSVFVFPYPFEEELSLYCNRLKVNDYINVIVAESIGCSEKEVKKFFDL